MKLVDSRPAGQAWNWDKTSVAYRVPAQILSSGFLSASLQSQSCSQSDHCERGGLLAFRVASLCIPTLMTIGFIIDNRSSHHTAY